MSNILKTLIDAIIGKTFSKTSINYSVEEKDSEIIITVDDKYADQFQAALNSALSSAAAFKESLPYEIKQTKPTHTTISTSTPTPQTPLTATPPNCSVSGAKQLLKNLFGEEAFSDLSIDLDKLFDDAAYVDDCIVFSKPSNNQGVAGVNNELVKYLLKHADGQPVARLREAYEGKNPLPKPTETLEEANNNQKPISSGLLEECFGSILRKNPARSQIFFNMKKFFQFLYPPVVSPDKQQNGSNDQNKVTFFQQFYQLLYPPAPTTVTQRSRSNSNALTTFKIDKDHFKQHVRVLAQSEVLFRLYKSENEATQSIDINAVPLISGKDQVQAKKKKLILLIDASESMQPVFIQVKNKLKDMVKSFENDEDLTIQITFFSRDIKKEETSIFANKEVDNMLAFIDRVNIGTSTNLFGSIKDTLIKSLDDNTTGEDENVSVILVSDGEDTVSQNPSLVSEAVSEYSAKKITLPKFIAIGLGPEYNERFISKIAQITGGNYEHLTDVNKFLQVLKLNKALINTERDLINFLVNTASGKLSGTLPIKKGEIGKPDLKVVFPFKGEAKVTISGQEYVLSVPDKDSVPSATLNDQLNDIGRTIRNAVRDDTVSIDTVLAECQQAKQNIQRLNCQSDGDKAYAAQLRQEIEGYYSAFQSKDKFRISDARSQAVQKSGIAEVKAEENFKCEDGVCHPAGSSPSLVGHNPLGRKLFSLPDEETSLQQQPTQQRVAALPSGAQGASSPYTTTPAPQTSSSERLLPPFYFLFSLLPFLLRRHPDEVLREQAHKFVIEPLVDSNSATPIEAEKNEGLSAVEPYQPVELVQQQTPPEFSGPAAPRGVKTSTNELPCFYPDGTHNVKTTFGAQPEGALMGECKLPKAPAPAAPKPLLGGMARGSATGFSFSLFSQLLQNRGIDPSRAQAIAQLAVEGGMLTYISQTSGYIPAALYLAYSHLLDPATARSLSAVGSTPVEFLLSSIGDMVGSKVGTLCGPTAANVLDGKQELCLPTRSTFTTLKNGVANYLSGWRFGGWGAKNTAAPTATLGASSGKSTEASMPGTAGAEQTSPSGARHFVP